ncbi:hypothetical protein ES708_22856 [subsurface metagenome]
MATNNSRRTSTFGKTGRSGIAHSSRAASTPITPIHDIGGITATMMPTARPINAMSAVTMRRPIPVRASADQERERHRFDRLLFVSSPSIEVHPQYNNSVSASLAGRRAVRADGSIPVIAGRVVACHNSGITGPPPSPTQRGHGHYAKALRNANA